MFFIFVGVVSFINISFLCARSKICSRRLRAITQETTNLYFIHYGQKLKFDGQERTFNDREAVNYLNKELTEFVQEITNGGRILSISDPIPHLGTAPELGGRVRVYEFKVTTDKGEVSIFLKWVEEDIESQRFLQASALGLAPPSKEILLGYIVSQGVEGTKLEALQHDTQWLSQPGNYKPLFKELGAVVARLETLGYSERLEHNLIVEIKDEGIKIWVVDYEDAEVSISLISDGNDQIWEQEDETHEVPELNSGYKGLIRDIFPISQQVEEWILNLDVSEGIKNRMLAIFKESYREAGGTYH